MPNTLLSTCRRTDGMKMPLAAMRESLAGTKRARAYATDVRSWWKLTYERSGGIRVLTPSRHWPFGICAAHIAARPTGFAWRIFLFWSTKRVPPGLSARAISAMSSFECPSGW
jgi:hypothetical protein